MTFLISTGGERKSIAGAAPSLASAVLGAVILAGCSATQLPPEMQGIAAVMGVPQNTQAAPGTQTGFGATNTPVTEHDNVLVQGLANATNFVQERNQQANGNFVVADLFPTNVQQFIGHTPGQLRNVDQEDEGPVFLQPQRVAPTIGGYAVADDPYGGSPQVSSGRDFGIDSGLPSGQFSNSSADLNPGSGIVYGNPNTPQQQPAPQPQPQPTNSGGDLFGNVLSALTGGVLGNSTANTNNGGQGVQTTALAPAQSQQTFATGFASSNNSRRQIQRRSFDGTSRGASALLGQLGLNLNSLAAGQAAQPVAFQALPDDMAGEMSGNQDLFLSIMIPIALLVNEQIQAERQTILNSGYRGPLNGAPPQVRTIAQRYEVSGDVNQLLSHVDIIPVSLMLAQSIEESGWGTSRFSQEGNALFGQYTWDANDPGMVPGDRPAGESFRIRAFRSLLDSMTSYALNLNRHQAYQSLRNSRAARRAQGRAPSGVDLVQGLSQYSTNPGYYIPAIQGHLSRHNLQRFDTVSLAGGPMIEVVGARAPAGGV